MKEKEIRAGVRVRCVDAAFKDDTELPFKVSELQLPKKGVVYTVRDSEKGYVGGIGIRLKELTNKKYSFVKGGLKEPIFSIHRFELI